MGLVLFRRAPIMITTTLLLFFKVLYPYNKARPSFGQTLKIIKKPRKQLKQLKKNTNKLITYLENSNLKGHACHGSFSPEHSSNIIDSTLQSVQYFLLHPCHSDMPLDITGT